MGKNKKHKQKIRHLSDEDYNAYIMALKDENPPFLIKEAYEGKDE